MTPYNISKRVVERFKRYLDDMDRERRTITWPTRNPQKLARQLREAIYASTRHPEYERFHFIHTDFRIRAKAGWVEAEYIGAETESFRTHDFAPLTVSEVTEIRGVVGACIKFGTSTEEIYFPNAVVSEEEAHQIYEWGRTETPHWNLIYHEDGGVTMTRREGVEKIYLWTPEGKDAEDS